MGSTNLNAPTLKMTSTAIGLVVILHVLAAMALVMVKSPAPIKPPVSQTPPIEIELLTLPAPSAEPEDNAIKPEPVAAAQPEPKPIEPTQAPPVKKAQPIEQPKPEPPKPEPVVEPPKKVAPKEPIVKNTEPKKQVAEPVIDTPPEPIKTEPFEHEVIKQAAPPDDSALIEETRQIAAAKEAAEAQARQEQIEREAAQAVAAEREAQVAREQAAAQAKKDAEAARVAAEKAAAEKAAASNTPVNFTASNADWSSPPNLSFPNRAAHGARSGDTYNVVLVLRVNKQGGIDSVRLAQSSGNAQLDRAAQRQVRSGEFKPFTKNGVPVVGNVTLPISYEVP